MALTIVSYVCYEGRQTKAMESLVPTGKAMIEHTLRMRIDLEHRLFQQTQVSALARSIAALLLLRRCNARATNAPLKSMQYD